MSSTNRGYSRHEADYYITPQPCIKDFLLAWMEDLKTDNAEYVNTFSSKYVFDPCTGGNNTSEMSYPAVLKSFIHEGTIVTMDIREGQKRPF